MVGGKRSPGTTTAEITTLQSLSGRIAEMPSIQHTQMGDMNRTTMTPSPPPNIPTHADFMIWIQVKT